MLVPLPDLSIQQGFMEEKMPSKEIVVYGTSWCSDCRRSTKAFDSKGVEYTWIDISRDKAGRDYVESVNNGSRSVPTMVFPDGSNKKNNLRNATE